MNLFRSAAFSLLAACTPDAPPGDEGLLKKAEHSFLAAQNTEDPRGVAIEIAEQFSAWAKTVEEASGVQIITGDWVDGQMHTSVATGGDRLSDASQSLTLHSRVAESDGWKISSEIRPNSGAQWNSEGVHFHLKLSSKTIEIDGADKMVGAEHAVTKGQN